MNDHRDNFDDTVREDRSPAGAEERGATPDLTRTAERPDRGEHTDLQDDSSLQAGGTGVRREQEVEILRGELTRVQRDVAELRREADDARKEVGELKDRYLRARADLENLRRRAAADLERSREAGLDSAVHSVLTVYDDLGRALRAAESASDPTSIVPGVRAVKDALERNLDALDLRPVGEVGEAFDPDLHDALSTVPPAGGTHAGTIAEVIQVGFRRGERLVRPARVVVYQERG